MPNRPICMNKLRTIIRLYCNQTGQKKISKLCETSRNTVKKYVSIWNSLNISYDEFITKSDSELAALFFLGTQPAAPNPRLDALESQLPSICKALGKKGMTLHKQWEKYIADYPDGYSCTQFRMVVRRYQRVSNPVMHIEHKAGEKMYIDYTGSKLWIYPPGEAPRQVEVFVAILGYSLLTYVEAVMSQSSEDLIGACENTFYYYGGVPMVVVPDNLKSAVTQASRFEPKINDEFGRFANHYGFNVDPARVRKPKDKTHVENAVKLTYKDIYTRLDGLRCHDLTSLNMAIRSALETHNSQLLSRRNYSRRDTFEEIERDELSPLNPIRFQIKKHIVATVAKDGHVRLREDIHNYSVPHTLIGRKVTLSYTSDTVDIHYDHDLVATHPRSRRPYRYTTNADHLCPQHRAIVEWAPEKFIEQAAAIHEDVEHYIRKVLEKKRYQEQSYKCCSGILNFARKVGAERLASACRLADSYGRYNYVEIEDILKKQLDQIEQTEPLETESDMPQHDNLRGKEYYK